MSRSHSLIAASSAAVLITGGAAFAGPMLVLSPPNIFQSVDAGFIVPGSYAQSTTTGRIDLNYCFDAVACVFGYSDVELGADPTIIHQSGATGVGDDSVGGGSSDTTLQYSLELVDPGHTAPEVIGFHGADVLATTGIGGAEYTFDVTIPDNNVDGISIGDCAGSAACDNRVWEKGSLSSLAHVSLVPNALYSVSMEVSTYAGSQTGNDGFAEIDPEFILPAGSTATLAFSPGVTSAAPEPAAWALMLVGVGGLGARLRSGRRRAAAA